MKEESSPFKEQWNTMCNKKTQNQKLKPSHLKKKILAHCHAKEENSPSRERWNTMYSRKNKKPKA
jgi:hypothetical protein